MKPYAIHPLAKLFPQIKGKRFTELVDDIKKNGLLHPVVTHEKQIVDGRNRLLACKAAKVTPRFVTYESLGYKCGVEDFIWAENVSRRQLTPDQLVMLAFERASLTRARARENQKLGHKTVKPADAIRTRATIAQHAQVTEHKVQQAERVAKLAPKLVPAVRAGKLKLKDAAKIADKKRPAPKPPVKMTHPAYWDAALSDLRAAARLVNDVAMQHARAGLTKQQARELESLARKILKMRDKLAAKQNLKVAA